MTIPTIYPRNAKTENVHNKNENAEDNAIRDIFADNETTNGGVFRKRKHPIYYRHHVLLVTQILLRKISKFRVSLIIR